MALGTASAIGINSRQRNNSNYTGLTRAYIAIQTFNKQLLKKNYFQFVFCLSQEKPIEKFLL